MSNILVVYFSATGTTVKPAKELAKKLKADLYEIQPQEPYTAKDLNWVNPLSRTMKEYVSKKEPEIKGKVKNMEQYDTIIIGVPIWFFKAPNIVNRFMKEYDFTTKKIGLFATSHTSGVKKAEDTLQKICPKANWKKGISANSKTIDDLFVWAEKVIN